jgi:hypothetical protein
MIETISENNLTGIVIDGTPYLYWLRMYQELGIAREHAPKIIARLTTGTHYIKFTKEEFLQLSGSEANLATVNPHAKTYYFVTEEGYNRAIMEIGTGSMNNSEIAAAIEAKKDLIANIFTRYQKGEVLSLNPMRAQKRIPGAAIVRDNMRQFKTIRDLTGCSGEEAYKICIKRADEEHRNLGGTGLIHLLGIHIPEPQKLIESEIPLESGMYISPTKIGEKLQKPKSAQFVNKILTDMGYQESDGYKHAPTALGLSFCKQVIDTFQHSDKESTSKARLIWKIDIINIINKKIEHDSQTTFES